MAGQPVREPSRARARARSLTWSASSDLDLSLGVQLFAGEEGEGNYGGLPPVFFLRGELFF